jgi:hypothetical protein
VLASIAATMQVCFFFSLPPLPPLFCPFKVKAYTTKDELGFSQCSGLAGA